MLPGHNTKEKINERSLQRSMCIVEKTTSMTSKEIQADLGQSRLMVSAHILLKTKPSRAPWVKGKQGTTVEREA